MATAADTDGFYNRLLELAEHSNPAEAVRMILDLKELKAQLAILQRLARHLEHDLVFAENLDFASDFFLKLMYARDNASALAESLTRDAHLSGHDPAFLARAQARASRLALILADPARLAREDDEPAAIQRRLAHDRLIHLNQIIMGVLNELTADDKTYSAAESETAPATPATTTLVLHGLDMLTPESLSGQVAPFIQALADIHGTIARVNDEDGKPVRILGISSGAGTSVEVALESDNSIIDTLGILRGIAFRQQRREYTRKKEALEAGGKSPETTVRLVHLSKETVTEIIKNVVNQIFHLPGLTPSSARGSLSITQQMRSLRLDIQQKAVSAELVRPVEFVLHSLLEVVEVIYDKNSAAPADDARA